MKLIKLSADHYVLTDDSEIRIENIVAEKLLTGKYELFDIHTLNDIDKVRQKKIMRSTQPIEYEVVDVTPTGDAITDCVYRKIQSLSLSEVKELLGVVDVEKKALEINPVELDEDWDKNKQYRDEWISGYNQALEDNKERKYTEEDMRKAYYQGHKSGLGSENGLTFEHTIQSLLPKTEWEVEFVEGKLKLKE